MLQVGTPADDKEFSGPSPGSSDDIGRVTGRGHDMDVEQSEDILYTDTKQLQMINNRCSDG